MSFDPSKIATFLAYFETKKHLIRAAAGCEFLELYQDQTNPEILFTYSQWRDVSDLENYRHSDLFKTVWATTKQSFNAKPEAWSVDRLVSLK